MKKLFLFALSLISVLSPALALTDICDITVGPDSKVVAFAHGQQVNISMSFVTDEPGGIRIFARPFTNRNLTPGYGASGSPLYSGSGTANGNFTINSGTVVVDEIRIEVFNADQSAILAEYFYPVQYRFGNLLVSTGEPTDLVEAVGIFPNPAGGTAQLSVSLLQDAAAHAYVTDIAGRRVADLGERRLSAHTQELFQIPAHSLCPGLYIVVVEGANFRKSSNLIVER